MNVIACWTVSSAINMMQRLACNVGWFPGTVRLHRWRRDGVSTVSLSIKTRCCCCCSERRAVRNWATIVSRRRRPEYFAHSIEAADPTGGLCDAASADRKLNFSTASLEGHASRTGGPTTSRGVQSTGGHWAGSLSLSLSMPVPWQPPQLT